MKNCLFSVLILFMLSFSFSFQTFAEGGRKSVKCRTLDAEGNELAIGSRCDIGWNQCIPNPCPSPNGTLVQWEDEMPSVGD